MHEEPSRNKFKILVLYSGLHHYTGFSSREFFERLGRLLPECEIVTPLHWSEDEILSLAAGTDVILGSKVSKKIINVAEKLKLIQTGGTGVDKVDVDAVAEKGVLVCNAVGLSGVWVAEHAVALMLALAKNIAKLDDGVRKGVWHQLSSQKLEGKTLGIVGLGSIGIEIAKRMKAFGMRIVAIKRHTSEELKEKLEIDFLGGPEDLDYLLTESDFLVISVVLTPETRRMIGKREFHMMKKTAFLVNISRGQVINESALIQALEEDKIAGAGLDVFEIEPISPDNPLLKMENVVLTPHVGGGRSLKALSERIEFIAENIKKVMLGKKPSNVIDTKLKYAIQRQGRRPQIP
jgi:D-3-phosphoglycerate dehydrogenase